MKRKIDHSISLCFVRFVYCTGGCAMQRKIGCDDFSESS